jgi:hypothetical protein
MQNSRSRAPAIHWPSYVELRSCLVRLLTE